MHCCCMKYFEVFIVIVKWKIAPAEKYLIYTWEPVSDIVSCTASSYSYDVGQGQGKRLGLK